MGRRRKVPGEHDQAVLIGGSSEPMGRPEADQTTDCPGARLHF